MKFPALSWIIAGTALVAIGVTLSDRVGLPFFVIGCGAILYGVSRLERPK